MTFKQEILPAVAAILFNEQGDILLQRRKDVNKWCILSGHVEFGESISEAVLREIYEETGARAEIVRFIGVYSSPDFQTYHYGERSVQYVTSYFEARFIEAVNISFCNAETHELKFFPPEYIPSNLALINPAWLQDALNRQEAVFLR